MLRNIVFDLGLVLFDQKSGRISEPGSVGLKNPVDGFNRKR